MASALSAANDLAPSATRERFFRLPGLTGLFISVWLLPFAVIAIGFVDYLYVDRIEILVVVLPAIAGWLAMRTVRRKAAPKSKSPACSVQYLRLNFYLFAGAAVLGGYLLRISYGMSGVGLDSGGIQEMYLAAVELQREGELSTGFLGTLAQLLRTAQPFAMIMGVFLIMMERGKLRRLFVASLLLVTTIFAYTASFSRGSVMFSMLCVLLAAWALPVRRTRLLMLGGGMLLAGVLFFLASASDRAEAVGIDKSNQVRALEGLFNVAETPLSQLTVEVGGPQLLGLGLYVVSPLAEGAHLIVDGTSPMMWGGFSFFPYVNPVKRILGADTTLKVADLDHVNMWFSAVGELFIDYGMGALIAFPLLAYLMYRIALRYRDAGLWGQMHFLITAVFFALFPFYSVFHSYGLVYAVSLALAIRSHAVIRAARTRS